MKVAVLLWLTLSAALAAELEFVGVMAGEGGTRLAITERNGGATRWLTPGQEIDGYTVIEFKPTEEELLLEHEGMTVTLKLRTAKVAQSPLSAAEFLSVAEREIVRREGWTSSVRYQGPHTFKGRWLVFVCHQSGGKIENRRIVMTPSGALIDYANL